MVVPANNEEFNRTTEEIVEPCVDGKLLYTAQTLRLVFIFVSLRHSRYFSRPHVEHFKHTRRVLRYLEGTTEHRVITKGIWLISVLHYGRLWLGA